MKMNKILSLILVISIVVSVFTFNVYADDTTDLSGKISYDQVCVFLKNVGIYDDSTKISENRILNRGEFIHYAYRVFNLPVYENNQSPFWDLSEDYEYYNSVVSAKGAGLINGHTDGSVRVYDYITSNEAMTVLINALGYKEYLMAVNNYGLAFASLVSQLELNKGINLSEKITFSDMSFLLYNALNAPIMEQVKFGDIVGFENTSGKTLLSENFDIYLMEGVVIADDISSIDSKYPARDNTIYIDDEGDVKIIESEPIADRLLGYKVSCYYYEKDDVSKLVYIRKIKNDVTVIEETDSPDLSGNTLNYTVDGKNKKVTFGTTTVYFKNGKKIDYGTDFKDALFQPDNGRITCIDNDSDSVADVVFVDVYTNYIVKSYSSQDEILFFKNEQPSINLGADEDIKFVLTDKYGSSIPLSSLKENDVLTVTVSGDKKYYKAIVSFDVISAVATEYSEDSSFSSVLLNNTEYIVLKDVYKINSLGFYINVPAIYYLDAFGDVAYIRQSDSADKAKYALLLNAGTGRGFGNNGAAIRILDSTDNEPRDLPLAEKVKVDGVSYNIEGTCEQLWVDAKSEDNLIAKFISYTLNDDGAVNTIDTPAYNAETESDLSLIQVWKKSDGTLTYKGAGYFVMNYYLDSDTKFYGIPTTAQMNSGDYECECYDAISNDQKVTPEIYALGEETVYMKGVLFDKEISDSSSSEVGADTKLCVVEKIADAVDGKGETCKKLYLVSPTSESVLSVYEKQYDFIQGLGKGDVIRYSLSNSGKLGAVHLLYDYSVDDFSSTGVTDSSNTVYDHKYGAGGNWIYMGTVFDTYDKFVKLAIIDEDEITTEISRANLANIELKNAYVVEVTNAGVEFTAVDANSLKTFKNSGKDAYKMIYITKYRQYTDMLFVK